MQKAARYLCLRRIDPERNMFRFYTASLEPNLFGGCSLVRRWGRLGTSGAMKIEVFDDNVSAERACEQLICAKLRRGYRLASQTAGETSPSAHDE